MTTAGKDTSTANATPDAAKPRRRGRFIVVGLLVVGVAAFVAWRGRERASGAAGPERAGGKDGARAGADRPVPVTVAHVVMRDVPITVEGLGSVTAFKTVNVRSQVDGRLARVGFREGQPVKRGDLLAEVDPRPFTIQLHQAQAALARDQAQLEGADRNLTRYAAVSAEKLIPQQQTDDQRTLVEQLRGTVQTDRAQIENASLMLSWARITSPIDGVTGVRQIDEGNIVHAADPGGIVVVTQMDPIAVLFTLPEDDLPRVARAQAAGKVAVEAMGRDGDQVLARGELALVDNQINQTTATLRGKAVFPNPLNPGRALWPNQFVRTRLQLDVRKGALVIPAVAIQRGPQSTFVYVAGGDGRAEQRTIAVDVIQGADALVKSGLSAGEGVVIEGQSQLRPGAQLAVRQAGADEGGGGKGKGARGAGGHGGGARMGPGSTQDGSTASTATGTSTDTGPGAPGAVGAQGGHGGGGRRGHAGAGPAP